MVKKGQKNSKKQGKPKRRSVIKRSGSAAPKGLRETVAERATRLL